jgi:hypothetical protein
MTPSILRARPDTAWVCWGAPPNVAVARVPTGPPTVLYGNAAEIWIGLVQTGSVAGVIRHLRESQEHLPPDVTDHVEGFVAELIAQGFIERFEQAPDPGSSLAT